MKLLPLKDKIIIKKPKPKEKTDSGILLATPEVDEEAQCIAEVEAVGTDIRDNLIFVGVKILFSKYAGVSVRFEGQDYLFLSIEDVVAVIYCE